METKVIVHQMEVGEMGNFVYLVACKATKEAAVVDPGWDVPHILLTAARYGLTITKVLLTHTHSDHINGVALVRERTKAPLHVHALEAKAFDAAASPLVELQDGDTIALGDVALSVLHTPGHSPGLVCFHVGDDLICGDVLFVGAIGRIDLRGADPRAMYHSLARLKTLPDATRIWPGHNYGPARSSTIGEEKRYNPYLRFESEEEFLRAMGVIRQ